MIGKRNATEDMKKMQEEAIKRVKEMHARSKPIASPQQAPARGKPASESVKFDDALKKENIFRKPNPLQRRNTNFNLRKTKIVEKISSIENANFKSQPKKDCSNNILGNLPGLMDLIFKDSDKSLIIVLIVLLMDDEENFMILLVLFYLLI